MFLWAWNIISQFKTKLYFIYIILCNVFFTPKQPFKKQKARYFAEQKDKAEQKFYNKIDMRIVYHDIDKKSKNKLNLFAAMDSGYSISYLLLPC